MLLFFRLIFGTGTRQTSYTNSNWTACAYICIKMTWQLRRKQNICNLCFFYVFICSTLSPSDSSAAHMKLIWQRCHASLKPLISKTICISRSRILLLLYLSLWSIFSLSHSVFFSLSFSLYISHSVCLYLLLSLSLSGPHKYIITHRQCGNAVNCCSTHFTVATLELKQLANHFTLFSFSLSLSHCLTCCSCNVIASQWHHLQHQQQLEMLENCFILIVVAVFF